MNIFRNIYEKIILSITIPIYISVCGILFPFKKYLNRFWVFGSISIMHLMSIKNLYIHYDPDILKKKRILLISNHVTSIDWYVISIGLIAMKKKRIIFSCKKSLFLASQLIKKFNNNIDFIFLKRNLNYDYITIIDECKKLNEESNFISVLFPEGTLITRKKSPLINLKRSANRNIPTPKNVIVPKTKGFQILLENLNIDCIVDCTLLYSNSKLNIINFIKGKKTDIDVYFNVTEIPKENTDLWLINLFQDKDNKLNIGKQKLKNNNNLSIKISESKKFKYIFLLSFPWFWKKIKNNALFFLKNIVDE